jgi:hypothetical protein
MREESSEPSVAYAVALLIGASLLAIAAAGLRVYLTRVREFPDMASYAEAATAVRHWQLSGAAARQFWGYPYVAALVSLVLPGVPMLVVLVIISAVSGCIAVALAHRLWGGWTAVYVTAVGWQWVQREAFGGSEPLFMALVLAAFLATRRDQWRRAALWAALATVVRPIGIFALGGLLVAAVIKRRWIDVALGCCIAAAVFGVYCVPLAFTGDALGNIHWYAPQMMGGTVWRNLLTDEVSPVRKILVAGAIAAVLVAPLVVFAKEQTGRQAENLFAFGTSCFLVTLNCQPCAWAFSRFAIVSIPFALLVVRRWLPRDDRVVCVLSIGSALIAAAMQVNDLYPGTALLHLFSPQ